jgi:hypothetical protein
LWTSDEITVQAVVDYFNGKNVVQIDRDGYLESLPIPKASLGIVEKAVTSAVESGVLWLLSGPASILGEPIPPGVLNNSAKLSAPPAIIAAAAILPENLPEAWKSGYASGLSISSALSIRENKTLPWKTIKDVIGGALQARFLALSEKSAAWPCDFPSSQSVILKLKEAPPAPPPPPSGMMFCAEADLEPSQLQDLGDIVPNLLKIKKMGLPMRFHLRIEIGDGKTVPSENMLKEMNLLLKDVKEDFQLKE